MAVFSTYLFPEIEPVDPFRIRSAFAVVNMIHISVFFNVIHAVSAGCMIHVSVSVFNKLILLWFLLPMSVGEMTFAFVAFFTVIGWILFRIHSVNGN